MTPRCTFCGHFRSRHHLHTKKHTRGACKDCTGRAIPCRVYEAPKRRELTDAEAVKIVEELEKDWDKLVKGGAVGFVEFP